MPVEALNREQRGSQIADRSSLQTYIKSQCASNSNDIKSIPTSLPFFFVCPHLASNGGKSPLNREHLKTAENILLSGLHRSNSSRFRAGMQTFIVLAVGMHPFLVALGGRRDPVG